MKLKVLKYCPPPNDYHECEDEEGNRHRVDLVVDGSLNELTEGKEGAAYLEVLASFCGKTVEVEYLLPYQEIGMNVRFTKEEG